MQYLGEVLVYVDAETTYKIPISKITCMSSEPAKENLGSTISFIEESI